jgi:hypothetical protein
MAVIAAGAGMTRCRVVPDSIGTVLAVMPDLIRHPVFDEKTLDSGSSPE